MLTFSYTLWLYFFHWSIEKKVKRKKKPHQHFDECESMTGRRRQQQKQQLSGNDANVFVIVFAYFCWLLSYQRVNELMEKFILEPIKTGHTYSSQTCESVMCNIVRCKFPCSELELQF